jgi:hypothetical protein
MAVPFIRGLCRARCRMASTTRPKGAWSCTNYTLPQVFRVRPKD